MRARHPSPHHTTHLSLFNRSPTTLNSVRLGGAASRAACLAAEAAAAAAAAAPAPALGGGAPLGRDISE